MNLYLLFDPSKSVGQIIMENLSLFRNVDVRRLCYTGMQMQILERLYEYPILLKREETNDTAKRQASPNQLSIIDGTKTVDEICQILKLSRQKLFEKYEFEVIKK